MTLLKDESVKIMNEFDKSNRSAVMNLLTHQYSIPEYDADDILQDAWVLLLDKLMVGELPDVPNKLLAYMYRVCSLKAHEYLRKREYSQKWEASLDDDSLTAEKRASIEMEVQSWADFIEEYDRAEHRKIAAMYDAVDKLNPRQKALLMGFHIDNKSMRELADQLGYNSEDVAKNTKKRIIASLRTGIQQQERANGNGLSPVAFLNVEVKGFSFFNNFFYLDMFTYDFFWHIYMRAAVVYVKEVYNRFGRKEKN